MDQLLNADERVREAQHRVKNSLQLVASMLSAQARRSCDTALAAGLRDAVSRIVAVAHLHENLQHQAEQVVQVDDYLRDICNDLALTAGEGLDRVGVQVHAEDLRLPGPNALALGLVANELVTNAFRHAYPTGGGAVDVTLTHDKGQVVLTVADQGVGRFGAGEGLGLSFVRLLAQKLDAELEISDAGPGTRVSVTLTASSAKGSGVDEATSRAPSGAGASARLRRPELRVE